MLAQQAIIQYIYMEQVLLPHMQNLQVINGQNCVWNFQHPSNSNVWPTIKAKGAKFIDFSPNDNTTIHYKPFANWSDDRLKDNEGIVENACETLSKLKTTAI